MEELETKKKILLQEILDLDNLRTERNFILKSIDSIKQEKEQIIQDISIEKKKLEFEIEKRHIYEKEKNIQLDKKEENLILKEKDLFNSLEQLKEATTSGK